ncbi:MAG TPA: lysylphosphatidylglycerol synthase transmembrane domain-containing protein [Flavobacteriaceae bacterium]|nr:lysylphosphatidylglycerol synthase transmembrane domain-containing protein [Flavobacteriaceae bacterium]
MNKNISKALQIILPLGLGIFLIWYIFQSFSPEQLSETKAYFSKADYGYVLLSVFLSLISHITRAYRWGYLLEPMGYRPRLLNNFLAVSVGYLFNIFIPRSGEVSRAVVLDKYEDVPFQKSFGTIIAERVIDLLFLLFFTTVAVVLEYHILYEYILGTIPASLLVKILIAIGAIALAIPLYIIFSKSKINRKIKNFVFGLKEGLFSILRMKRKTGFVLLSLAIWVLYVLSFYAALRSLPDTGVLPIGIVIISFVVGSFTLTFTHNGFGTYPAAMAGILFIFGVAKTAGVAIGWIIWTSNILSLLVIGVVSLMILPAYNRQIRK